MFSSYTPLAVYPGNGVQTDFAAPDKFYDAGDVRAVLVVDGNEVLQQQGVDFSVVVVGRETTPPYRQIGLLRFAVPPPTGANVVPFILPDLVQDQAFEGRPVTARQHERVHDRHVQSIAMLFEFFNRGYRSSLDTPAALRFIAAGRTGYVPTWDDYGNLIEGPTVNQVAAVAENIEDIQAVAAIAAQVNAVAAIDTEIAGLYPVRVQIAGLYPVRAQIATLAPVADDIEALGPVASQIAVLGDMAAELLALYAIRSQVIAVAAIDGDVQTVAANIAAIILAANNVGDLADKLNKDGSNVGDAAAKTAFRAAIGAISADDVPPVENLNANVIASGIFNVNRIPTLDINNKTSGVLSVANGGTGATSVGAAPFAAKPENSTLPVGAEAELVVAPTAPPTGTTVADNATIAGTGLRRVIITMQTDATSGVTTVNMTVGAALAGVWRNISGSSLLGRTAGSGAAGVLSSGKFVRIS